MSAQALTAYLATLDQGRLLALVVQDADTAHAFFVEYDDSANLRRVLQRHYVTLERMHRVLGEQMQRQDLAHAILNGSPRPCVCLQCGSNEPP